MNTDNSKYGVKTFSRNAHGQRGTMFRVPNPPSQFNSSVKPVERRAALKEYLKNCHEQYQAALTSCVKAG
jgi:hypothetical protein